MMDKRIKHYENNVYAAVISGELKIDGQGRIWRIKKKGWDRWRQTIRLNNCREVRAEHRIPLGYLQIRVMFDKKRYHALAHRLVYRHFKGEIPEDLTVNHKNGIKDDNRPENLELATNSGQVRHMQNVLLKGRAKYGQWGAANSMSKLTDAQVAEIRKRRSDGETLISIAKDYGVAFQTISKIAKGQSRWCRGLF